MHLRPTAFIPGLLLIGIIAIILLFIIPEYYWSIVILTFPVTLLWGWYCATRNDGEDE
jgi:hypothetical protein